MKLTYFSEIFDMPNPFATMSPIAEGSDGCAAHEDMNFVQVPQSEDHDMDPSLMSNIVVKKKTTFLNHLLYLEVVVTAVNKINQSLCC